MREGSKKGVKIGRTWLVKRTVPDGYMKRTAKMAKQHPRRFYLTPVAHVSGRRGY